MGKFMLEKPIGGDLEHIMYGRHHPTVTTIPHGFNIDPWVSTSTHVPHHIEKKHETKSTKSESQGQEE